jgi:exosortase
MVASAADIEFIGSFSIWTCLVGLVLYTLGREIFRELRFALFFLLFMIPWPDFLAEAISFPLQLWSTRLTVMLAGICGLPATYDGTSMYCGNLSFQVVAACSGVRSMVILLAIGAVFAHLLHGSFWRKLLLFLLGVPIALIANIIRLFSIILVGLRFGQEIAGTIFHEWASPVLFLISSLLLLGVWFLLECEPKTSE